MSNQRFVIGLCFTAILATSAKLLAEQENIAFDSDKAAHEAQLLESKPLSEGERLLRSGMYGAAIDCFSEQLERNPKDVNAMMGLGVAYNSIGVPEPAIKAFERCLSVVGDNPKWQGPLHSGLAIASHNSGLRGREIVEWTTAVKYCPDQPFFEYYLCVSLAAVDDWQTCLSRTESLIDKISTGSYDARSKELLPLAQTLYGNALSHTEGIDSGAEALVSACEKHPRCKELCIAVVATIGELESPSEDELRVAIQAAKHLRDSKSQIPEYAQPAFDTLLK
jgi:tetratricopeptide (TPR) repeat protein